MFVKDNSKNKGLAVTALLLTLALSSLVAMGIATYYKETRSAELNVDKTTYLQSIEGEQSVNKFSSTPVSNPLPRKDGDAPLTKVPKPISLAGLVTVNSEAFTNTGSTSFSSIKEGKSGVSVVRGGNSGTVVSGTVIDPSASTPIPSVGNATITPPTPLMCTPGAPTPSISNVSIVYTYSPSTNPSNPATADSGMATWIATLGGRTTTVSTPVNTGGTISYLWSVDGYNYDSSFTCRWRTGERGGRGGGSDLQTWLTCDNPTLNSCASSTLSGGNFVAQSYHSGSGSTWTTRAALSLGFNPDGTYQVVCTIIGNASSSPCAGGSSLALGTWLPVGRSASDFTIAITLTPSMSRVNPPVPCAPRIRACAGGTDGDSYAGSGPYTSTGFDPNNGSAVTTVTSNGGTASGVIAEVGGHDFMRSDPAGSKIGGALDASINVVLIDKVLGAKTTAKFGFNVNAQ